MIEPKNIQKIPLTSETIYHSLDNRYLTNSRIGDWLKCKQYFKELHITGERPHQKETDALKVGKAVDTYIFEGEKVFREKFIGVTRRNIKNPPINITELTVKQFDDCLSMAQILSEQPAVKEMSDHKTQEIIILDMELGDYFCGISAIPDWYKIDGDTAIITDLKTAYEADEHKYHWKCVSYGYYRQVALMRMILEKKHPELKKFIYRHIVIQKDPQGIFIPFAFYLADEQVAAAYDYLKIIIKEIKDEKEFLPKTADWKHAPTIGSINDDEF